MKEVIFKYTVPTAGATLHLPRGSVPISVGAQGNSVVLWVRQPCNPEGIEVREFDAIFTGNEFLGERRTFIGTATTPDGLVWHVFERHSTEEGGA